MSPLKTSSPSAVKTPVEGRDRIHVSQSRDAIHLKERNASRQAKMHEVSTLESQALFNQAMEFIHRNRYGKAIGILKEALHIAPDNPYYLSYLGLSAAYVGDDYDSAITLCRRALALCPGDATIHVNLGKAYRLKGDIKSAHSTFIDAWRRNREHPAPAAELSRMGIRRPPVLAFLDRSHVLNVQLGKLRSRLERMFRKDRPF